MINFDFVNNQLLPALVAVCAMLILLLFIASICVAVNCTVNYLKYKDSVDKVCEEQEKIKKDNEVQQLKDSIVKELKRSKRK